MWGDALRRGYVADDVFAEEVGLDGADAEALDALDLVKRTHQSEEVFPCTPLAEVPDIDPRQDDFLAT